jgi:D-alanyl-lipoteichoic acid acyltransferase DltB (MBOAT superfamily)
VAAAVGNQFLAARLAATRGDPGARRRPAAARAWLAVAVAANLAVLGLFKYYDFFAASLDELLSTFGLSPSFPLLDLVLPVGISFLTFRMLTYVIDVARGGLDPVPLLDFAVYVAFFPYLLAGPIARAAEFLPQLRGPRDPRSVDAARAFRLILGGLAKKVLIADYLATHLVNGLFTAPDQYSSWETLIGIYAYAVQIYCDFSGYTDIAIGMGRLLGIRLPENFAAPFLKPNLTQLWNSWHITLTQWFRAYFFNPVTRFLRTQKQPLPFTFILLLTQTSTMLLIGLWHGITWNFALWGLWHGLGLFVQNRWSEFIRIRFPDLGTIPVSRAVLNAGGILLTFIYFSLGIVFFALSTPQLSVQAFLKLFGIA